MFSSIVALSLAMLAPSAYATILDVNVGPNGQFVYEPPFVHASPGDIVRFHFNPKNHTVTQSAFDPPCVPLQDGFRTGFIPVAPGTNPLPVQEFHVPDDHGAPLWFYCGQTAHCGQGMVFAINPPAEHDPQSFQAHKDLAIARNGTAAVAPPATTYTPAPEPHWTPPTTTVPYGGGMHASHEPAPTHAVTPQEHRILVGADGKLAYSPANITAAVGDTVVFEFRPKNHTVTQSSFSNPCVPLEHGFKSGFQPVAADATDFPTFRLKINDTAPIWGYCGQVNHCQSGMVFSINAVESGPNNFAAFQQLAMRPSTSSRQTAGDNGSNSAGMVVSPSVSVPFGSFLLAGLAAAFL
ncbi:hypothetical protein H1R20_g12924, partial [Candolleomyces eurysporus]